MMFRNLILAVLVWSFGLAAFGDDHHKVVIFTANLGAGHNSAAKAIAAAIKARDPETEVVIKDMLELTPLKIMKPLLERFYERMTQRAPWLYEIIYGHQMAAAERKKLANEMGTVVSKKKLIEYLKEQKPDVVIGTNVMAPAAIEGLRIEGIFSPADFRLAWMQTDYVASKYFFLHSQNIEMTFLPHSTLRDNWTAAGIDPSRTAVTGMAVNPEIFAPFTEQDKAEFLQKATMDTWVNGSVQKAGANQVLLSPHVTTITIAGGQAGVGDYPTMVKSLIESRRGPIQIVALTGKNQQHYDNLTKLQLPPDVTLVVESFIPVSKALKYIRSSQGYIVKSGGLSTTESAVIGVPTLLLDINGGQERDNSEFFRSTGMALVTKDQSAVGKMLQDLINDPLAVQRMKVAQNKLRENISTAPIVDFVFQGNGTTEAIGCGNAILL